MSTKPPSAPQRRCKWYLHYTATGDLPFSAEAHIAIMRAVAAGDPEAAERAADRLIDFAAACSREQAR